ncbi:hypothetical protein SROCM77S_06008 [Streptomyces rochei]
MDRRAPGRWLPGDPEHAFTVVGDAPADAAWTERVTRANSRAQLQRLAWLAERWTRLDDLVMSFEDTVRVNVPAELVFDFLYRAGDWPDDLAGTRPLTVQEDTPGIQVLALDGRSATGGEAVRISFPAAGRLVHKHTRTSGPLAAYTGEWTIEPQPGAGLDVTVRHEHHALLNDDAALDQRRRPAGVRRGRPGRPPPAGARRAPRLRRGAGPVTAALDTAAGPTGQTPDPRSTTPTPEHTTPTPAPEHTTPILKRS